MQNSVPVAQMGSATTSQQFIRQVGDALGVSAFVLGRVDGLGANRADLAVLVTHHQVGVHFLDLLGDQAELRHAIRIEILVFLC